MFRTFNDVLIPEKIDHDDKVTKLYTCDFCSEGWASETEVELHRANFHKPDIVRYMRGDIDHVCKMCITQFDNDDALYRHIRCDHLLSTETAIRVEREIYICDYCEDVFFNKMMLTHHIYYTHLKKKNKQTIKCPTCSRMVRLASSWFHFRRHGLQGIACCKICCRKFKDRRRLGEHLKTHPFQYTCSICSYNTKKGDLFNCHIQTVHKKPEQALNGTKVDCKMYFAPQVYRGKSWKVKNLMGWMGVRLTNNIHICVLCREICLDNESMERHISVDHMDQKRISVDHKCTCGLQFSSKVLLKHHMFKFHEPDTE